jgi:hypothetical protein
MIESSSEEEEEDEEKEYDEDEMTIFIKKFNKYISKRRSFKGDRKEKTRSKGCITTVVRMDISMPNVYMRGKMRTTTRKKR